MSKHSPIPWEYISTLGGFIHDSEKIPVIHLMNDKANADLIVLAVNSHDKLVKLLKDISKASYGDAHGDLICNLSHLEDRLSEALEETK